jgi:RNA polymerase sigma-70 factor (ECF subfamily)
MDLDAFLPGIVARDTSAFGRWMSGAEAPIRDSLRSFAARVDVEAIVQETLLRVWRVAPRFVPDGRPNGLLRLGVRVARNLAVSELRRTRATPAADDELERAAEIAEPDAPDPMLRKIIEGCRERLPDKPREALEARLTALASDAELAAQANMRLNTFLQNFGRARRMLAECLRKHGVAVPTELEA